MIFSSGVFPGELPGARERRKRRILFRPGLLLTRHRCERYGAPVLEGGDEGGDDEYAREEQAGNQFADRHGGLSPAAGVTVVLK